MKAKKSPNKLFARKIKKCHQKMQLEKNCFHTGNKHKKNCLSWKIFHPPPFQKNNGQPLSTVCQITFMKTIGNWAADGEERTFAIFYLFPVYHSLLLHPSIFTGSFLLQIFPHLSVLNLWYFSLTGIKKFWYSFITSGFYTFSQYLGMHTFLTFLRQLD